MLETIDHILLQHADEAFFLWGLRTKALKFPHFLPKALAEYDVRVEAHLDGLRIAGDPGWEICKEALGQKEAGEVFAASVLAFESGKQEWIDAALEVGSSSYELSRGVVSALGWMGLDQGAEHAQNLLSSESPIIQRIGIAARSIHRQDPGQSLILALAHEDMALRTRALKAVGELGRTDLLRPVTAYLNSEDVSCRFAAAFTAALFGDPSSIPVLQELAIGSGQLPERAGAMALRRMTVDEAHTWQKALSSQPDNLRLAVQAVGVIGDPISMPWLIEQMAIPDVARVAGESFSMITGVDLAYEDLEGEGPEGFEAGPTEEPEDENVEMDADEDLPWPNQELIHKWWTTNKLQFSHGTRYLCGQPMTIESLKQVLRTGYQRQRIAAAIELAMRQPGKPLFETRAPGFRQQSLLG